MLLSDQLTYSQERKTQLGTISDWREEKGYGFITPTSGGKAIFAHIKDYSRSHRRPFKGLEVIYRTATDERGRKCAIAVCPLCEPKNNDREIRQKIYSVAVSFSFSVVLSFLYYRDYIPVVVVALYAFMSIFAYLTYAADKRAAELHTWRTSEATLHLIELLGGWPGAALAQSWLRHKSKKWSFRIVYMIVVIMNCSGLYWLVTPQGSAWMEMWLPK